ncbi:HK97 family phage prohead protease [Catalinimonas sp. 4WD22]|uniref:HK97 family phage prohead protease n=1 Tax=Catalinimonas locisalis TaxID=3133978 RepID=UPI0031011C04
MNYFQTKTFDAEVKDLDEKQGIVTGYFSKFDNVDHHGDVIRKGAFQKSISERGPQGKDTIKHLYQHDTNLPLGKIKHLSEDDYGLYFESQIVKTSYGNDVIKLYAASVIDKHSIGFKTLKEQMKDSYNEMTELMLWEGSTVTFPANEEAGTTGFKSLTTTEAIDKISKLEKAIKDGTFTDDTFHLLIISLKQLQQAFHDLEKNSLTETQEPDTTTSEDTKPNTEDQEAKNVEAFINKISLKYTQ